MKTLLTFILMLALTVSYSQVETILVSHTTDEGSPVDILLFYEIITVPGVPGLQWLDRNLGAIQQPESKSDESRQTAGWYYQFNRHNGHITPGISAWEISEPGDWSASFDPCTIEVGDGWHVPTVSEWKEVDRVGKWNNRGDAFNSILKLHCGGRLDFYEDRRTDEGKRGYYWSSSQGGYTNVGISFYINASGARTYYFPKGNGQSVRCVKTL